MVWETLTQIRPRRFGANFQGFVIKCGTESGRHVIERMRGIYPKYRSCHKIPASRGRRASGPVLAAHGKSARLPEEQFEQLDQLQPRASARPQDIGRSGRIRNESLGQSKDGQAAADVLVARGRPPLAPGAMRDAG
jgi:hypothetical protein